MLIEEETEIMNDSDFLYERTGSEPYAGYHGQYGWNLNTERPRPGLTLRQSGDYNTRYGWVPGTELWEKPHMVSSGYTSSQLYRAIMEIMAGLDGKPSFASRLDRIERRAEAAVRAALPITFPVMTVDALTGPDRPRYMDLLPDCVSSCGRPVLGNDASSIDLGDEDVPVLYVRGVELPFPHVTTRPHHRTTGPVALPRHRRTGRRGARRS